MIQSWLSADGWLARLIVSIVLGGLVGFERQVHGRPAGLRTHMLVCLGATLMTLSGLLLAQGPTTPGLAQNRCHADCGRHYYRNRFFRRRRHYSHRGFGARIDDRGLYLVLCRFGRPDRIRLSADRRHSYRVGIADPDRVDLCGRVDSPLLLSRFGHHGSAERSGGLRKGLSRSFGGSSHQNPGCRIGTQSRAAAS